MSEKPFGKELLTPVEVQDLIRWFTQNGVKYPWGGKPTPYRVWISEIMLQQTVVTAAVDHFNRWMDLFPDISVLACADEQSVLKAWEGLGYYSRARNPGPEISGRVLFILWNTTMAACLLPSMN